MKFQITKHNRLVHAKGKSFSCTFCDKSFAWKYQQVNHVNTIHKQVKPLKKFSCTLCDKSFKSGYDLTIHLEGVHYQLKAFSCTFCEKSFSLERSLNRHYDAVHNKLKPFFCTSCNKSFSSKILLDRHVSMHGKPSDNLINCTICGKSLGSNLDLTLHINAVHHKLLKDLSCTLCNKSFTKQEQLTAHKAEVHPEKFFTCTMCNKVFSSEHFLTKHVDIKHEKQNPIVHQESKSIDQCTFDCKFWCKFCGKSLGSNLDLTLHINAFHHKLLKNFSCTLCSKSFTEQEQLTAHKAVVHQKSFSCTLCNKSFLSEQHLARHIALKHENLKPIVHQESKTIDQCTFDCRFCDMTLISHEDLKNHEKFCEKLTNQEEAPLQIVITNKSMKQDFSKNGRKGNGKLPEKLNTVMVKKYYLKEEFKQNKCRKDASEVLEFVVTKAHIGQACSNGGLKSNEELIETFNAVLRCPKCNRYYRKDKLKQHIILCEHDAKTQSISDSILNHTATGMSHPIVITPVTWDDNTQDGFTLESKTETRTSHCELSKKSNTTAGANCKSETIDPKLELFRDGNLADIKESDAEIKVSTDVKIEEREDDNEDTEEIKEEQDVLALVQTRHDYVMEIKPETSFQDSHDTGNIHAIQPNDNIDTPEQCMNVCEPRNKLEPESDIQVPHMTGNVHVIKPEDGSNDQKPFCQDDFGITSETKINISHQF